MKTFRQKREGPPPCPSDTVPCTKSWFLGLLSHVYVCIKRAHRVEWLTFPAVAIAAAEMRVKEPERSERTGQDEVIQPSSRQTSR